MSNIVFLSSDYLGVPSANGVCARNLVSELRRMGHGVDVVCFDQQEEIGDEPDGHVYTLAKPQLIERNTKQLMLQTFRRVHRGILGGKNPLVNDALAQEYCQKLYEISSHKRIDAVVAMFFPAESAQALYQFKKANPQVKTFMFELDSFGDGAGRSRLFALYKRSYEKWLSLVYQTIDHVFIMHSHEDYWKRVFARRFGDKLTIADIPVLLEKPKPAFDPSVRVSMIYSGLIERDYRSPSYLLAVLGELQKSVDFTFSFYSKGDCEDEIHRAKQDIPGLSQMGYVPLQVLEKAIHKADYLVSIGNSFSRSVPSKMIAYFAYCKPIIHFSSQEEDVCKEYLKRYPLALVIDQTMPIEEASAWIERFIAETRGKTLEFESVRQTFQMNDPLHSASLIASLTEGTKG